MPAAKWYHTKNIGLDKAYAEFVTTLAYESASAYDPDRQCYYEPAHAKGSGVAKLFRDDPRELVQSLWSLFDTQLLPTQCLGVDVLENTVVMPDQHLTVMKMVAGNYVPWHHDASSMKQSDGTTKRAVFTCLLYVGESAGGQFEIVDAEGVSHMVTPQHGACTVFSAHMKHRVLPVENTERYAVIYRYFKITKN